MNMRTAIVVIGAIATIAAIAFWFTRSTEPPAAAQPSAAPVPTEATIDQPAGQPSAGDPQEEWFPDLNDRNDIPGVYLGIGDDRSTFGCDVDSMADGLGDSLEGDEGRARFANYMNLLAASGDAEHQLAALQLRAVGQVGVFDGGVSALPNVDHLALALESDPLNPLVLWQAAGTCIEQDSHSACSDLNVRANMQTVLGSNGEYWAQESARLYVAGDTESALDALRRAGSAPGFDNYFMKQVRLQQRALSLAPDLSPVERNLGAYALGLVATGSGPRALAPCFQQADDPPWFDACTAVANRYISDSPTIVQQALGMEMLARLYAMAGQEEAAQLEKTRASELGSAFWVEDEDLMAVLFTDERVFSLYLDELESGDEFVAVQFLRDEVERLKQDPDYTPCPSEGAVR